jgi:hypothetical protein
VQTGIPLATQVGVPISASLLQDEICSGTPTLVQTPLGPVNVLFSKIRPLLMTGTPAFSRSPIAIGRIFWQSVELRKILFLGEKSDVFHKRLNAARKSAATDHHGGAGYAAISV